MGFRERYNATMGRTVVIKMVDILKRLKKDLKEIKHDGPDVSHIVFKQKMVCDGKKKTQYYKYIPNNNDEE